MKLDWKLLLVIVSELVIITALSILVGSILTNFYPGMNEFLRVLVSLAGGYILSYILFFIFGVILGLFAHIVLDDEQLDEFYSKNLQRLKNDDYELDETQIQEEEEAAKEQITVASANLDEISENKIGTYLDKDIPEWIKVNGEKYVFSHVLMKNALGDFILSEADLATSDVIYPPGIVFKKSV